MISTGPSYFLTTIGMYFDCGGRKIVLSLFLSLAFNACGEGPTSPDSVPNVVVKENVRFQAVATAGDDPFEVLLEVELLNASAASRHVTWGGCGIAIRLYRSASLVYESHPASGVCEEILNTASLGPAELVVLSESFMPARDQMTSGRYTAIMVFQGKINDTAVALEVRAGDVDL